MAPQGGSSLCSLPLRLQGAMSELKVGPVQAAVGRQHNVFSRRRAILKAPSQKGHVIKGIYLYDLENYSVGLTFSMASLTLYRHHLTLLSQKEW